MLRWRWRHKDEVHRAIWKESVQIVSGHDKAVKESTRTVLSWLVGLIALAAAAIFFSLFGEAFRKHTLLFLLLWAFFPFTPFLLRSDWLGFSLGPSQLRKARIVFVTLAGLFSLCIFAHGDYLRDELGKRCVQGYSVLYYEDSGDEGQPGVSREVFADHWYAKVLLWALDLVLILLCIGEAWATWRFWAKRIDCLQVVRR